MSPDQNIGAYVPMGFCGHCHVFLPLSAGGLCRRCEPAQWDGNPKGEDPEGLRAKHDSPVPEGDAP
jgi:hypothetical protein